MRLRELYAKRLASSPLPIALPLSENPKSIRLQREVVTALGRCLEALLYPDEVDSDALFETAEPSGFDCGLVFAVGQHELRLKRGVADESVELQILTPADGTFVTRARGAKAVAAALAERLGRPPYEHFLWLQMGGGTPPEQNALTSSGPGLPPEEDDAFDDWLRPDALALEAQRRTEAGDDVPDHEAPHLPNPLDFAAPAAPARRSAAEIDRLRTEYRRAQQAEAVEDRINELRRRLAELTPSASLSHDPVLEAMREELSGSPSVDASDEEIALLRDPEGRVQDFERRREALERNLQDARQRLQQGATLLRSPVFVAGAFLTLACTAISVVGGPSLRAVALANVAWLAGALAGVLQYLQARDDRRTYQQRIFALEEAQADLEEERRDYDRELGAVRRRHGVQSAEELEAIRRRRRELANAQEEAEKTRRAEHDEVMAAGKGARAELETQLERLEAERRALGDCPLASFQIAQELRNLGLDPEQSDRGVPGPQPAGQSTLGVAAAGAALAGTAGTAGTAPSVGSWTRREPTPPPLFTLASELGLVEGGGLEPGGRRLWGRMLAALLNRPLSPPDLAAGETVVLSRDTGLVWSTLAERERALVVESASLALLLRSMGRTKPAPWPFVVRLDPFARLGSEETARLETLYGRLSEHLQIVVLDSGRRGGAAL